MRIGELLLERSWVDEAGLERVLAEQQETKVRLCTLLVARDLLDFDHAARALGDQHRVPCALIRHLEYRDPELARLLPAALARQLLAVPIGRGKNDELVVCVRDPSDAVRAALADATQLSIVLAVAPIGLLARHVNAAYARQPTSQVPRIPVRRATTVPPAEEFDVDMSTGPVPLIQVPQEDYDSIPFASFNLVELDDVGVTKDFTQHSGQFAIPRRPPTDDDDDLPIEIPRGVIEPAVGRKPTRDVPRGPTLRETLAELEHAKSSDDATEIAMAYVVGRWASSLLFMIKEGAALGHRGHGPNLSAAAVGAVAVPLGAPSIVSLAHDARKIAKEVPPNAGAIQARLTNLLGLPDAPVAAPIVVGNHVAAVLAVGDPQGDPIGTDRAELEKLCAALGTAYARVIHTSKRT